MYSEKYSFLFLINDLLAGIKTFFILLPIMLSLGFFCGESTIQGLISCAVASIVSSLIGGSKYQISSVTLPLCVITFEITSKYQYKGLLFVAIFVSIALIIFGMLRLSEVIKHMSYAFISALSIHVFFSIIINQLQYILDINTIQSSQSLIDNFQLLKVNCNNVTSNGIITAAAFILPLIILRIFTNNMFTFFIYILTGCILAYCSDVGYLPSFIQIKTIGNEFISNHLVDNIFDVSKSIPSQTFLINCLNYAFAIAIVIASEACFCTNVSSAITGDRRLQTNIELISTGIANFVSIACGGLFISPNATFSIKNISFKTKSIAPILMIAALCYIFLQFSIIILQYIPIYCLSSILICYAVSELFNKKIFSYFNIKKNDCYIFLLTLIIVVYFGFITAVIVGFIATLVFFSQRMVMIKDATVHTTKNHDTGAIEFMLNKNGFSKSKNIPDYILNKIEVVQISNILFLNIAKIVEESLSARGKFPSVLIIYFRNIPFLDGEALNTLKDMVKSAAAKGCITMVSGTNGMLLDVLQQKAAEEKSGDVFGYIVPNFDSAIDNTVKRLKK
jgi:SulP family sulfate permease